MQATPGRRAAEQEATGPRWNRDRGLLITALGCGAYLAWLLFGHGSASTNKHVSDIVSILFPLLGFGWSLRGAHRNSRPEDGDAKPKTRGAWSANLLSASLIFYAVAASLYTYYDLVLHQQPFPSWADLFYLLSVGSTLVSIVLIPSRPIPGVLRVRILLDSLMVLAALVTFSWYFALGPTVLGGDESWVAKVIGAAYPVMDLAMMFCTIVLFGTSQDPELRRVRNFLCISVFAYVIADSSYLYLNLKGTYETGQPLDAGWFLANLLFAQAAATLRRLKPVVTDAPTKSARVLIRESNGRAPSFWRMLMPYALVPAVAALDICLYRGKVTGGLANGAYFGSGILLALILARQIFAIAENTRLYRFLQEAYRELEALATTDGMTGLWNHRTFQEKFREQLATKEEGASIALLLIDVDRFKSYNDAYGHPAGDEALRIVGTVLKASVRELDFPARYGGEEFAAILPGVQAVEARLVAERIRAACEAQTFPCRPVTLSIGVVVSKDCDADSLIERADQALYSAKRAGRNQVVVDTCLTAILDDLPEGSKAA